MATKLYLRQTTANGSLFSNGEQSTLLPNGTNLLTADPACDLSTTAGAGQTSKALAQPADTVHYDSMFRRFISDQIDTAVTTSITSGTWTIAAAALQTSANLTASLKASLYVLTSADTVRGFIWDNHATAWTNFSLAETGVVNTFNGGIVGSLASGDRICLEMWVHTASSMATSYTWTVYWDGTTDPVAATATSNAASYISTPQTIAFGGAPPPAINKYLTVPRQAQFRAVTR